MSTEQSATSDTIRLHMAPTPAPGSMVLVTRLSRVVYQRAKETVLGISLKEYMALGNLREQQSLSQQGLCEALHLDPNNCVLLLNVLENNGLIQRRRDPSDRRRHIVVLTDAGRSALERADRALESVEDEVLVGLSDKERTTLHDLLARALYGEAAAPPGEHQAVTN